MASKRIDGMQLKEMFASGAMRRLIEACRAHADYVIIDTPPK